VEHYPPGVRFFISPRIAEALRTLKPLKTLIAPEICTSLSGVRHRRTKSKGALCLCVKFFALPH